MRKATFSFTKEVRLYIRYNDYNEYSYHIQYSPEKYDRIRFDNFDKEWDVKTRPHHLHLRNEKNVKESPMIGDPNNDMDHLLKHLIKDL
jgi:hypothetical protein